MSTRKVALGVVVVGLLVLAAYWLGAESKQGGDAKTAGPIKPVIAISVAEPNTVPAPATVNLERHRGPQVELADDGSAPVPLRYQFAGVERVQTGMDFENWMAQYSAVDQEIIRAFSEKYFGIYENRTSESIAWMAANGYLMPEDIIAAQAFSTEQLQQLANNGNDKAAFLLKDRYLNRLAEEMDASDLTFEDAAKRMELMGIEGGYLSGIYQSASPYKAYLTARIATIEATDPGSPQQSASILAALTWARNLGDLGADRLILDFVQSDPDDRLIRSLLHLATDSASYMTVMQRESDGFKCGTPAIPYPLQDSTR